jgi:hypothetical protein
VNTSSATFEKKSLSLSGNSCCFGSSFSYIVGGRIQWFLFAGRKHTSALSAAVGARMSLGRGLEIFRTQWFQLRIRILARRFAPTYGHGRFFLP